MMQFKKGLGWKASIGPPTDMVIDENYAELGTWTNIQKSGNVMSEELTDIAVDLWELHPKIEVWETFTPYFDRRNIHFYINRLGFHAVEFFNEHHPDPHMPEQFDQEDGLFKFEKRMR